MRPVLLLLAAATVSSLDDGLARTPPMGYRTWNDVHGNVNVSYIKAMVDAVASRKRLVDGKPTSLLDLGYGRVGLDDGWQACGSGWAPAGSSSKSFHAQDGTPLVNTTKFPSLKQLVEYGHSKGLLMGWYDDNCICMDSYKLRANASWAERSYAGDVAQLLQAGFDGVKIDNCGSSHNISRYAELFNKSGRTVRIENW